MQSKIYVAISAIWFVSGALQFLEPATAQQLFVVRQFSSAGAITAINNASIAIQDKTGKSWEMRISNGEGKAMLGIGSYFLAPPTEIDVQGDLPMTFAEKGFPLRIVGKINRDGRFGEPVSSLLWINDDSKPSMKTVRNSKSDDDFVDCTIDGTVESIGRQGLVMRVPRSRIARKGVLNIPLAEGAVIKVNASDLSRVTQGDEVTKAEGVELTSGDFVLQSIEIRIVPRDAETSKDGPKTATKSRVQLDEKYRELSDQPGVPRPIRGTHYVLHTDMSDRDAQILLDKLEAMLVLVSKYFERPQQGIVECYVVDDLQAWPPNMFPPEVLAKLESRAGLTRSQHAVSSAAGRQSKAVVYACNKHDVVQHEAVHAYCQQTFGSSGPTWYSEGMAELGRHWKESQLEVDIEEPVLRHIRSGSRTTLQEILAPGQITGDSWQAYATRWALCYLLANNPNYNKRFKALGMALMANPEGANFDSVYGPVAKELAFEYDQFLQNVGNGYRADLCAWIWNARFVTIDKKGSQRVDVEAKSGWLPANVRVEEGRTYDFAAKGEWAITGTGDKVDADGGPEGAARLTAVVMHDFQLSDPISLGKRGTFVAPSSGDLYVRCGEAWTRLADNSGSITLHLRLAK